MTTASLVASRSTTTRAGRVCLVAAAVGVAQGIALSVVPAMTTDDRWSYPLAGAAYAAVQASFFVQHLGLVAGIVGLRSAARPSSRLRRTGVALAVIGMVALGVVELVAILAVDQPLVGDWASGLGAGYGVTTMLVGVGLVLAGVSVVRDGRVRGPLRWVPLGLGVFVFVPLTPALVGPFLLGRLAIVGWMVGFAWLGLLLTRADARGL